MESETAEQNRKARQREYYLKHREKMLAYSRRYLQEHPEKRKLYQENAAKREKKKPNPDIDKAKSLFRDPAMAEHLQWLFNHAASKNK